MHIFTIEGNIGAGKSTILQHLRGIKTVGNRPLVFLPEPVHVWETITDENGRNILQLFYSDQAKYSFAFQMTALISRYCLLEDAVAANPGAVLVTERCLYTDYHVFASLLHDTGHLSEVEYAIYKKWFSRFNKYALAGIIYLDCTPEIAKKRCEHRNREGEVIELDYLQLCKAKHEWIEDDDTPLLRLDANQEISDDLVEDWVDSICLFMEEEVPPMREKWKTFSLFRTVCILLPLLFYGHTLFYYGVVGN